MWSPFLVITVPPLATLTPDDETVTRGRWDDRQWNRDRSRPTDWHGNRSKIIIPIPCATWSVRLSIVPHSIPSLSLRPAQRSDWGTRERVTEEWAQRTEGTSGPWGGRARSSLTRRFPCDSLHSLLTTGPKEVRGPGVNGREWITCPSYHSHLILSHSVRSPPVRSVPSLHWWWERVIRSFLWVHFVHPSSLEGG